ncbi:hypothetical protein BJX99DRAFT_266971 [Aspergillus californicus]
MQRFFAKYTPLATRSATSPLNFTASLLSIVTILQDGEFIRLWKENKGNPLLLQCVINIDVLGVTRRIRRYVLKDAQEAWRLKESYRDTLAMEAVASAIIAQISITVLSLSNFDTVYWPATAFAYSSLICGILSTFFAFLVQQLLSNLHSPEDVHAWLTTTRHSDRHWPYWMFFRTQSAPNFEDKVPSIASAVLLTTPSKLLRLSILALFVALGIYLGCVYQAGLGNLEGRNSNMWVFVFFIAVSVVMLFDAWLPLAVIPDSETRPSDEVLQALSNGASNIAPSAGYTSSQTCRTGVLIRDALESSIRAQEESLKAQKTLLDLLNAQPSAQSLTAVIPSI